MGSSPFRSFFRSCISFVSFSLAGLLPVLASAATLRGVVLDPDGRPAPAVRIAILGARPLPTPTTTDDRGEFRVTDLEAGRYELHVAADGFSANPVIVALNANDERDVSIRLRLSAISESIIVSASQVEQLRSRTADSVTVITAADLRARQTETVADALRAVPGLTVTRSGGRGLLTSLFPRGGESDFTLVLVDGMRANAFGGGFDFAHLPIADVERIEVVRGPESALYGSDAIGAVVQIITRHGGVPRADAMIEAGSFGTTRVAASSSGSAGDWRWGTAVERLDSDGFTGFAPAVGERVSNDDYRRNNFSASLGWSGDRETLVRGDVRVSSDERGFPGPFGSDPNDTYGEIDRISRGTNNTRLFSLAAARAWTGWMRQRAQVSYADLDSDFVSPFGASETATGRAGIRFQNDFTLAPQAGLSAGFDLHWERADNTFITGDDFEPVPVRRFTAGYFAEARYDAASRASVTGGVRLEHIRRATLPQNLSSFAPRPAFEVSSVLSLNPKFSAIYFLRPPDAASRTWTRLRASAGTGIRSPDAIEIAFTDNPDLRPERTRSLDFGVEQGFAGGAVMTEATGFFNHYDDLIVAVGPSLRDASRFRTDNISNARARGLEIMIGWRTRLGLGSRVAYTWLDTTMLAVDRSSRQAPVPFQPGDPLLRRPRHQAWVNVTLTRGPLTAYAEAGARGRMLDVDPSLGTFGGLLTSPGYAVVHSGVAVRAREWIEIFARINNLFDRQYEEILGFPALGRSFSIGARVAARR